MKANNPLVSVVMPVHNAGNFLRPAVASILNQTYKNIELIVIDDASNDDSLSVIKSFKDKRIMLIRNKKNLGITKSANLAIKKAKGEFIARMDGDDVASPDRIARQVKYLLRHQNVVALGGQCELIDAENRKIGDKRFPTDYENIRKMIFVSVPVQQPTIMVAVKRLPENFVWYDETYKSAEELELLFKLFEHGEVRNLKSTLLKYRIHKGNTSLVHPKKTFTLTLKTRAKAITKYAYRPSVGGVVITVLQSAMVYILPEVWIYPIYSFIRNPDKLNVKLNVDANLIFKKAYQLVRA